jgi:hypothetical protein
LYAIAGILQITDDDVLEQEGSEIADMGTLVDRGAAGKQGDPLWVFGLEKFQPFPQAVK